MYRIENPFQILGLNDYALTKIPTKQWVDNTNMNYKLGSIKTVYKCT